MLTGPEAPVLTGSGTPMQTGSGMPMLTGSGTWMPTLAGPGMPTLADSRMSVLTPSQGVPTLLGSNTACSNCVFNFLFMVLFISADLLSVIVFLCQLKLTIIDDIKKIIIIHVII